MATRVHLLPFALLSLSVCVCVTSGFAQNRPQPNPQPGLANLADVTLDGVVQGVQSTVQGLVLRMKTAEGHLYDVWVVPSQSKMALTGAARPDFLKLGMLVRFNGAMLKDTDKNVELESPPAELRIFADLETQAQGAFEDKAKNESCVVAKVRTYKDGKLTVSATGKTIVLPVPADMEIELESTDPANIRPGDSLKVTGKSVSIYRAQETKPRIDEETGKKIGGTSTLPEREGKVIAKTVEVKLQGTLNATTFKKKPGAK